MAQFVVRTKVIFLALLAVFGTVAADEIDSKLLGMSSKDALDAGTSVWGALRENMRRIPATGPYDPSSYLKAAIWLATKNFKRLMAEGEARRRVIDSEFHLIVDTVNIPIIRLDVDSIPHEIIPELIENFRHLHGPYLNKLRIEPYESVDHPKTEALIQTMSESMAIPYELIEAFRQEYKQILQQWLELGEKGEFGTNIRDQLVKYTNYMNMNEVKALRKLVLFDGELIGEDRVSDELKAYYFRNL